MLVRHLKRLCAQVIPVCSLKLLARQPAEKPHPEVKSAGDQLDFNLTVPKLQPSISMPLQLAWCAS
jgi:hypothetical protein